MAFGARREGGEVLRSEKRLEFSFYSRRWRAGWEVASKERVKKEGGMYRERKWEEGREECVMLWET